MNQQQLTKSQLPITHEVLIETECANSKQIDGRKKTNPNNQNHPPILERNCKVSRKPGAGISKLCFRYTETIPYNNATEDDNRKNNNCDKR